MAEPVWITGIGLVSSLGEGPEAHRALLAGNATPVVDATSFAPFPIHPAPALELDRQIPKKGDQRQMEPWQRLGTYAAGLALDHADARGLVADMHLVVGAGAGERDVELDEAICNEIAAMPPGEAGPLLNVRLARGLRPTLFLAQLSNLLAGNISIVHGVTGSSRTFMGEESAAADAVRIAAARLAAGRGEIALVGGAYVAGRWDMLLLYAASGGLWRGEWATLAAREATNGGGLICGTGAAFLVLETARHARARGVRGLAALAAIRTDAARRQGRDSAAAAAARLAEGLDLRPGMLVVSGASGAAPMLDAERDFLAGMPEPRHVVQTAEVLGHAVEAAFPTNLALAALAVADGAPQALVTGFGVWRGEALALLEPIGEAG
jgi:3-oxoacyl-[acyl-carrier-protein] synthase II